MQSDPTRFVSGSDDGTVKLWNMRDNGAVSTIDSKANVCSVQLSPQNSNLLAFGSANQRAYLYDLRKVRTIRNINSFFACMSCCWSFLKDSESSCPAQS